MPFKDPVKALQMSKIYMKKYLKTEKGKAANRRRTRNHYNRNRDRYREIKNQKAKESTLELTDTYANSVLRKRHNFTSQDLKDNPEITLTYKLIIKTKRLCKTSNN